MTAALRTAACALALTFLSAAAHAQPDFTGVWRLASPPMTSAQGYPDVALTPEGLEIVNAYRALVDPAGANPTQWCVSHGMPEMMMGGGGYPLEIIQKPDQVTMLSEWANEARRIYLGDRIVPAGDVFPSRHGYSTGRWDGDVLVVETGRLQEMADSRFPHSAATGIVERFRLTEDAGGTPRLIADTVVTDPEWLAGPLEYRLEWVPAEPDWILPYECRETEWFDYLDSLAAQAGR